MWPSRKNSWSWTLLSDLIRLTSSLIKVSFSLSSRPFLIEVNNSSVVLAIPPPDPPKVKLGLIITGKFILFINT